MKRNPRTPAIEPTLKRALQSGRNVLLEGSHGIGKSSIVQAVARELDLRTAYFNAATLDPFADLVGIPVPLGTDDQKKIRFLRADRVNEAEVICFDDLNRAPARVLNSVFELIQFRSVNGEPLPRLRSVVGIINPNNGDYEVQELDPALLDRFHVFLTLEAAPSREWFVQTFGLQLGSALVDWHTVDLDQTQRTKLSPRRLEYLGRNLQDGTDPAYSFPPETKWPLHLLRARLQESPSVLKAEDFLRDPKRFESVVSTDMEVAVQFSQVLLQMRPQQKAAVKWIVAALPAEILASLRSRHPFLFKEIIRVTAQTESADDANAYLSLLNEKLETPLPAAV